MTWREFTERLNPEVRVPPEPNPAYYPYTLPSYKARMRDEELGIGLDLDSDIDGDADLDAGREGVKDEEARMVVDDEDGPKLNTDTDAGADAKPVTKPIPIPTRRRMG
jgi:hypothetical protein